MKLSSNERKKIDNEDVLRETEFVLNELSKRSIKLTWLVVAELADWYPQLIKEIAAEGHEIGYHTHNHEFVIDVSLLRNQLSSSSAFLQEYRPLSFQAPAINFFKEGYKTLKEHGFLYDLSVYGKTHEIFSVDGVHVCPVSAFYFRQDNRPLEYPAIMNKRLLCHGIPFGSSFWYVFGFKFINFFIDRYNRSGQFVNMFVHNWQLFPSSKRAKRAKLNYCRRQPGLIMYVPNVEKMFFRLMDQHSWGKARDIIGCHINSEKT